MNIFAEGLHEAFPIIQKFAPVISTVIGGVPGIAATSALSLLGAAFNAHPSDLHQLATNIMGDTEAASKLTTLEGYHASWLPFADNLKKLKKAEIHLILDWDNATDASS